MLITLNTIIRKTSVVLEDSIYRNTNQETMNYRMNTGDFWSCSEWRIPEQVRNCPAAQNGYDSIEDQIKELQVQIKNIKKTDDIEHRQVDTILALRKQKKELEARANEWKEIHSESKTVIAFKKVLEVLDFDTLSTVLPAMSKVDFMNCKEMPYFVSNLAVITQAQEKQEDLAVTGGPCLFGLNEVDMCIHLKDGSIQNFDYSTGRHFVSDGIHMASFVKSHVKDIESVEFINHKQGVTSQEYDSILYLFEIADALNAKVTIPIPDMSYVKYLKGIFHMFEREKISTIVEAFRQIAYTTTDLYLETIEELKNRYPKVEVMVIHEREQRLCEKFVTKREPYIEVNAVLRKITGIPEKIEAIKDYIAMPALPFYMYGIKNIIQVDCIDETDSYRKCRMAHKKDINLACILYPEKISKDGENTIFFADRKYKEYRENRDK